MRSISAIAGLVALVTLPLLSPAAEVEPETILGLKQTLIPVGSANKATPDVRRARLAALYVSQSEAVSPFFDPGPFTSTWEGYLNLKINDFFVFNFQGKGSAKLEINGKRVLTENGPQLGAAKSEEIDLRKGNNQIRVTYQSLTNGGAEFRLYWWNHLQPKEPIPPEAFACDAKDPALLSGESLRTGRWLFSAGRCIKCHLPETDFAKSGMPELGCDSPNLTGVGDRLNRAWIADWLTDPQAVRNITQMPSMLHSESASRAQEANDIAAFLASLSNGKPNGTAGLATFEDLDQIDAGQTHYEELGCMTCHTFPGEPPLENEPRLSLAHLKAKWKPAALMAFLQNPAQHYQWIRMPNFQTTPQEATALTAYLLSNADPQISRKNVSADPEKGRELVINLGCLNCHTAEGFESALKSPSLSQIASVKNPKGCLTPGTAAAKRPAYFFSKEEQRAVTAFLQSGLPSLHRRVWPEFANRQFDALQCIACHAREDEGDRWAVLLAGQIGSKPGDSPSEGSAPKDDLEADFADEFGDDFGEGSAGESGAVPASNIHQIRPPLNFAGEKINPDWMEAFIAGKLSYKPRARMKARMPNYPVYAPGLAAGLAMDHGFPSAPTDLGPVNSDLAEFGKQLIQADRLGCVSCHAVADAGALSGPSAEAINLQYAPLRLRPHYYNRYVLDPQRVLTVTMMPKYPDEEGKSPITDILEGDARKQFEAIWQYLRSLSP